MSNHLEVPRLRPDPRPTPEMPSACEARGCGGAAPRTPPPPPTFSDVRVNGVEIPPEAIAQEIQYHPAGTPEAAWTEAVRALAIRELLLQEARRLGVDGAPERDEAGRVETDDDATVAELLDQEVEPELPSKDECRRYYDARRERFRTADLFEVSHILLEPEGDDDAAWRAAGVQARALIAEIANDPTAFASLARELSACPSAAQDGSLGQVRRGELVSEVQKVIETLAPGETHRRPVRSDFGWHVIRLHRRIEGNVLPFEAVCDKIFEMLAARSWTVAATRYVADLAARAEIEGVVVEPAPEGTAF
jgi:peptidyl-prolyl cis-trans isomerase C